MRVGHRIIEINGQSVVAVPHEKIVSMLASSVGEVNSGICNVFISRLFWYIETQNGDTDSKYSSALDGENVATFL